MTTTLDDALTSDAAYSGRAIADLRELGLPSVLRAAASRGVRTVRLHDNALRLTSSGVVSEGAYHAVRFETRFQRGSSFRFAYTAFRPDGQKFHEGSVASENGRFSYSCSLRGPEPTSLRLGVGGVSCFHIQGDHPKTPAKYSLLVDTATFLIKCRGTMRCS